MGLVQVQYTNIAGFEIDQSTGEISDGLLQYAVLVGTRTRTGNLTYITRTGTYRYSYCTCTGTSITRTRLPYYMYL